ILQARLDGMRPDRPANAKIRKAAEVLTPVGWKQARAETTLELLWPFALAVLGELGTIVCLSYGLAREPHEVPVPMAEPVKPMAPELWAAEFRRLHCRNSRLDEMRAQFPGIAKTTAWRKATGARAKAPKRSGNVVALRKT